MWEGVKALTSKERKEWIVHIGDPRGRAILFNNVSLSDVDLLEALKNADEIGSAIVR